MKDFMLPLTKHVSKTTLITVLALLVSLLSTGSAFASETVVAQDVEELSRQQLLDLQGYLAWQKINDARRDPLATAERLGVPVETLLDVFGEEDYELLAAGLPVLAWDPSLFAATADHGRDMFTRVYYSHTSPERLTPADRVAETGYEAAAVDETLAALVFKNVVDIDLAVGFMLDTMMMDELTGTPGVARNIFSAEFTEVGISFFAESVPLLDGQPYVYMFILDFAQPKTARQFVVGKVDEEIMVLLKPFYEIDWLTLENLPGGAFQFRYPVGGAKLISYEKIGPGGFGDPIYFFDWAIDNNQFVDLRLAGEVN